jgi:hypothetical protein
MTEKKDFKPSTMVAAAEEPHKSRYSDKELEEFDQLIDQKLIVAREQLEFYLKQLEDMAENPDNKIKGLDDGFKYTGKRARKLIGFASTKINSAPGECEDPDQE